MNRRPKAQPTPLDPSMNVALEYGRAIMLENLESGYWGTTLEPSITVGAPKHDYIIAFRRDDACDKTMGYEVLIGATFERASTRAVCLLAEDGELVIDAGSRPSQREYPIISLNIYRVEATPFDLDVLRSTLTAERDIARAEMAVRKREATERAEYERLRAKYEVTK